MRYYNHTILAFPIVLRCKHGHTEWQNELALRNRKPYFDAVTTSVGFSVGSGKDFYANFTNSCSIFITKIADRGWHGNTRPPSKMAIAVTEAMDKL